LSKTDLIIVGGGAAGMMGGCIAGDLGIKTVILERKHKPGRKLLMCGNSRCNLTINLPPERMLKMYGEPVGSFLGPALTKFSSSDLQRWFAANGLKTVVRTGSKVYPHSDRASDVLHFFTDYLRDRNVSMAVSSAVKSVEKTSKGFRVTTDNFAMESTHVLFATGGVSYPKTGSVGDGQAFAERLGHTVDPYRPGLVGFEVDKQLVDKHVGESTDGVRVEILSNENVIGETFGTYEIEKWGIGGSAITDASRIIARLGVTDYKLRLELPGGRTQEIKPHNTRPIKEAMVTVGGVSLAEIANTTMESLKCPGLYFAGEIMDVDGPTGGYNLQAAFSSARLAVTSMGARLGLAALAVAPPPAKKREVKRGRGRQASGGRGQGSGRKKRERGRGEF
jgi:predicted flavoprotein YhiN